MNLHDVAEYLLARAEARGQRGRVVELLTEHPGCLAAIAGYLLRGAADVSPEAIEVLALTGIGGYVREGIA